MSEIEYKKSLIGKEDLLLGFGIVNQTRGNSTLPITKINSDTIPYDNSLSIKTILDSNVFTIDTVDDFNIVLSAFNTVIVKDINRGGTFVSKSVTEIDPNTGSLYVANSGTVFAKLGGGFWVRQYNGSINVKWFNAKGDGVTDDTIAIQNALNSNGKIIQIPKGIYVTTSPLNIPVGVSFVGAGQSVSKIKKAHSGNCINISHGLVYNGLEIGGFGIYAESSYMQTGIGVNISSSVREIFRDINVSDLLVGIKLNTCYTNSSNNITIDRCGTGLLIQSSNHNSFNNITIISNGFIGIEMSGTSYSNKFDTIDIEYTLYPLWLKTGTKDTNFINYYAEFNQKGARLDSGVRAISFNGVFNSSVELFDTTTFAATAVTVNNLLDEYPVGIGGVAISGNIGNPGINTTQNNMIFQSGTLSTAYDFSEFSKFSVNSGSHFEWTGESRHNFVNSIDLSNGTHWAGSGAVTATALPVIADQLGYSFPPARERTHVVSTGSAMANRTFTVCVLVIGVAGDSFKIKTSDNVTATVEKKYVLGKSGRSYCFQTTSWGASSSNASIAVSLVNTSLNTITFALPGIWESPGAMPLTTRTRTYNGYTTYPIVKFRNFGNTIEVFGSTAPTTSYWKKGDVVINTSPSAGGTIGWICTTEGVPGTWKSFGAISA